jgi:hypothetical protein
VKGVVGVDNIHTMTIARVVAILALGVCTACGGSSAAPMSSSTQPLSVSPSSVTIGVPVAPAVVNVSNATGTVTARADNPLIASLSVNGSNVTIVPIASGQATIAISSGGTTVNVPLTIAPCTPPNPALTLAGPANGATGVSTSQSTITLAVQNFNGYTDGTVDSSIVARVVSSTGTDVVTAAPLQVFSVPAGVPGPYFRFAVPALPAQTTFTVQAYVLGSACLPADIIGVGSFST